MILLAICLIVGFISGIMRNLITAFLFGLLLIANYHGADAIWWYVIAFLLGWITIMAADWNAHKEASHGNR